VIHGNTVHLAGLVAEDEPVDLRYGGDGKASPIYDQTKKILARVDHYLARAGTSKSKVLSAQVWIRDMAEYDEYNRAWDEWVDPDNQPVRATVEARLARDTYKIEIMITAAI
jgi:enamine deaminase RidA (YjgF/YER057c/UK114 family)